MESCLEIHKRAPEPQRVRGAFVTCIRVVQCFAGAAPAGVGPDVVVLDPTVGVAMLAARGPG